MKFESGEKKKAAVAAALMSVACVSITLALQFGEKRTAELPAAEKKASSYTSARPAELGLRADLQSNDAKIQSGNGRDIFRMVEVPHPVDTSRHDKIEPPPPQVPKSAPVVTLKFFGYTVQQDGPRKAFLTEGDEIFVARENDIVNRRYKLIRIMPKEVLVEDLLDNNQQHTITLNPPTLAG